jgi:hypothetical protein
MRWNHMELSVYIDVMYLHDYLIEVARYKVEWALQSS